MTTLHPNERAKQLRTTGVPVHFTVAYYEEFDNCEYAERKMHDELKTYRTSFDREFFSCPLKIAIALLQELKLSESKDQSLDFNRADPDYAFQADTVNNQLRIPSEALSKITGAEPITRVKANSDLWEYIKQRKLQDPHDRKLIRCDDIIKSPHGLKKITIMELTGWLIKNLHSP